MFPIVGGSAAAGSRLGSGGDLPFSYPEHNHDGDDERKGEEGDVGEGGVGGGGGGGVWGRRRIGKIFVFSNMSSVSKSNLTLISFYQKSDPLVQHLLHKSFISAQSDNIMCTRASY